MARGNKAVGAAFNDGHTRSLVPAASRGGAYSGTMLQLVTLGYAKPPSLELRSSEARYAS